MNLISLIFLSVICCCCGFSVRPLNNGVGCGVCRLQLSHYELDPEPEGGEILTPRTSIPGCQMKQMDEVKKSKSGDLAYSFWMSAQAEGALIKEIRTQILKDASKKANFPGFKKVGSKLEKSIPQHVKVE
jgi:hypothetical protein